VFSSVPEMITNKTLMTNHNLSHIIFNSLAGKSKIADDGLSIVDG
jgi:hypothetical protein